MEILTSFFDKLTHYEFLSSLSSIDFYNKKIHMKSFFWRGLVVLSSGFMRLESKTKKRKLCYMLKAAMMKRLTKVSATALKKFFMHKIHISVNTFADVLTEHFTETTTGNESDILPEDIESGETETESDPRELESNDSEPETESNLSLNSTSSGDETPLVDTLFNPDVVSTSDFINGACSRAEIIGLMQQDYNENRIIDRDLDQLPDYNNPIVANSATNRMQQLRLGAIREEVGDYLDYMRRESSGTVLYVPMTLEEVGELTSVANEEELFFEDDQTREYLQNQ
jgi:hypothetical protein